MTRPVQARSIKTLENICQAAEALIARQGLTSLTIEAVAAEAGVSKGGVLHHFRSKERLIAGLVSRKMTAIRAGTDAEERALAADHDRALLGMLRHCARQYDDEAGFPPALLVAAVQNADCREEFRALLGATLARIKAESPDAGKANVLVFAALGLLLTRALGFSTLNDEEGRLLFDRIERLATASG